LGGQLGDVELRPLEGGGVQLDHQLSDSTGIGLGATGATAAPPVLANDRVLRGELVSMDAVGLAGVLGRRAEPAKAVRQPAYGFEMARPNTVPDAAEMVDFLCGLDGTHEEDVHEPVNHPRPALKPKLPIPLGVAVSGPQPAWAEEGSPLRKRARLDLGAQSLWPLADFHQCSWCG
jgi:hypothetical protein